MESLQNGLPPHSEATLFVFSNLNESDVANVITMRADAQCKQTLI